MGREIEVLGIRMNDFDRSEIEILSDEFLNNDHLDVLGIITTELLVKAGSNEEIKEYIEKMDVPIIMDKAILSAVEDIPATRFKEIENKSCFEVFLKVAIKQNREIYLFGDNEEKIAEAEHYLLKNYHGIRLSGRGIATETMDVDSAVNELNAEAPDVILALMKSPFLEKFVMENKSRLNAKVWFTVESSLFRGDEIHLKKGWIGKLIGKSIFRRKLSQYHNEK